LLVVNFLSPEALQWVSTNTIEWFDPQLKIFSGFFKEFKTGFALILQNSFFKQLGQDPLDKKKIA
jgi:hypothetical protein